MKVFNYSTQYKTILGDLHTPVSTYLKVRDTFAQSALMESSDYNGSENNRSFIGLDPVASVGINRGVVTMNFPDGSIEQSNISAQYTIDMAITDFLGRFNVSGEYNNYCGLYGYTTFNAVRYSENIEIKESTNPTNDAPDILYILYKYIIIFNDYKNDMLLLEMKEDGKPSELSLVEKAISNRNFTTYDFRAKGETTSTLSDDEHKANIAKGIEHCMRGDVFQIVLSRRFVQKYEGDDFKLYRALRSINPSPYLFYFDFGGFRIFGSSPETHCKIEGDCASIDPIAGTTRRTGDKQTDANLAAALLADPKENAEHVMLVDLARNDLSRNCHNVEVEFYKQPQYYSHVIHLVSRVNGTLDKGVSPIKAFFDTFP
ncbi:MAG: chorismate-binding protein, partial [Rikenellaceae bacterium]